MAFTMHSHSGQFCPGHAKDQLEDILKHAVKVGFKTVALTEHMPRYEERDLYPEELDDPAASLAALPPRHEAYLVEAQRLRKAYASQVHVLIGFEAEFIRADFASHVKTLAANPVVDFFIGSVHHVHGVPIDFDKAMYARAVSLSGAGTAKVGSEEALWEDYYDLQRDMLLALKPRVVGHFDLIRLLSEDPGRDVRKWEGVWTRARRNLDIVLGQGGWLEVNSAGLRKGLEEPYPGAVIAREWVAMGGRFTFSDDSHGIEQVATRYGDAVGYLEGLGVKEVWTLRREGEGLREVEVPLGEFREVFKG